MYRKCVCLLAAGLLLSLVVSGAALGRTLNLRISAGGDDAEQHVGNGSMDITSSDLEIPYEDNGDPAVDLQITGLRFVSVPVTKGAMVTKAYVEFEVDSVSKSASANPVNVLIQGELTPDAAPILSAARHFESRSVRTAATVQWSIPAWTKANDKYQSSDISAVVQEIFNQDGWAPGNALMLFVVDDPENPSTGLREAESFNGEAGAAPLLYLEVFIPEATEPVPANGALEITNPLLQWTAGDSTATQEIYLGTNPVLGPNDLVATQDVTMSMYYHIAGLTPGTTYYWRVDEIEADGTTVHTGQVWNFTTMPLTAHFPNPYDGALWRKTDLTASWTPGQTAVSHVVYADTDKALVAAGDPNVLLATIADAALDATGLLEPDTTYYWRVDEVDAAGTVYPGEVWTFSTIDPAGGAVAEYWDNMTLAGDPKVVTIVPEINFDWGDGADQGVNSPDPCIPTNNFSCRWTAALNVPVSGTYRLYDATDDGGRLFLNGQQIAGNWVDRGTTEDASANLELVAGQRYVLVMEQYENGGGATAYLRWSGPGIPKEIIPQGALQLVTWATEPQPEAGAEGLGDMPMLSWTAGVGAVEHTIFLSTDKALVTKGDAKALVSQQAETDYVPAALKWNSTYYWRVDEVAEDGSVVAGDVWSFKVADYIPVIDGAVALTYDNTVDPFITELVQEYVEPQDFTKNGVTSLQLQITGDAPKLTVDNGTITLQGAGADIWGTADQFRYAFKTLNGDGSAVVRVVSNGTGSNRWAKGGVMIRQSTDPNSAYAIAAVTGGDGNGAAFQWRTNAGASAAAGPNPAEPVAAPYWVKIDRVGNSFTGSISADANDWTQVGDPVAIEMDVNEPVLIGLAVTSHAAGELRTFEFDSFATTGDVAGDWTVADIGVAQGGNDPAPVYVALVDSDGKKAVVQHPDNPNVTVSEDWMTWKILTSSFSGVNLKAITQVIIGVGDGQADGTGTIQVADVQVVKPITIEVVNPSFEQPNASARQLFAPPAIRFESVPGWSTDKEPSYSCVRKDASPTNGSWAAFLWGGDPSIWQITGHTVVEGEAFQLDVDSAVVMGAVKDNVANLQISLCYVNDAGKRVTLASKSFVMAGAVKGRSLSVSSGQARAAVGHQLGIEIANVLDVDNGIGVDNVRLKTK